MVEFIAMICRKLKSKAWMLKQFAHYCEMQAELKPEGPNGEGRLSNQNSNPNLLSSASITVAQFPGMLH